MTNSIAANIRAAAQCDANALDLAALDPDDVEALADDSAHDWRDLYGSAGASVYAEEFCAAAWERLGL